MWEQFTQTYTPLGNVYVPAIFAVIPIVVLSLMLGILRTAANSGQSWRG
jgi:Na+/H+-dicarboxylate symporter